ncbi:MAG: hypothetical protein RR827_08320 [Oscillospiraceae bacterium]
MIDKDIKKSTLIFAMGVLTAFRLFLAWTQYATITPPLAPIDDNLMFKLAQSITAGEWLGQYNYLTLSKHALFSVWLAFLNLVQVPYLVGNAALWAAASLVMVCAIGEELKLNFAKLFLFAGLLYNPAMWAQFTTRVYRDSIFPSLCLLFFASVCAIGLRYKKDVKSWLAYLLIGGISFGGIYLCREDGVWVLPFVLVAVGVIAFLLAREHSKQGKIKAVMMVAAVGISLAIISTYSYINYQYYGRFIVSDFTSTDFERAYGALTSIEQERWNPLVSVPCDVREKLYKEVASFAPIEEALEEPLLKNGYYNEALGDFQSGGFYWALRTALQNLGVYETPQKAQMYYEKLYDEIKTAVEEGRLPAKKLRSGVTSPIKPQYILPVIAEGFNGFKTALLFEQCDPLATKAVGYPEEIAEVEGYIHQRGGTVLRENSDEVYLPPIPSLTHKFMRIMNMVYKICIPIMFIISLLWQIKQLGADVKDRKFDRATMLNVIMLGFVLMALLRCFMIGFVEVSAFDIGTYVMYLSTVHPLIIAYSFIGFCKTFEG